jgi:hypothetical protein
VMGELKRVCGLVPAGHWSIAWMDRINRTTCGEFLTVLKQRG